MGEVYRARDPRLDREVAIKILPRRFMEDAEYLARFEREARMLAALNHPHIATIHGLEDIEASPGSGQSTVRAIVLELVEGETLAERIASGRVPIGEALAIARQIAEALDAAHVKGIVHRDLKPANVKLTPGGVVKVLDFGLAKITGGPDDRDASEQATMLAGTKAGVILGTTAYMSPEQARGQPVDKRTDIWAFGCVLFELLTASAAFHGGTMTDTLAAIVDREPAWDRLPAATPAGVRRLLQRCLEKDASRRLRDIGDVRAELEEPRLGAARRTVWPWVAAAAALAAALVFGRGVFNRSTEATALPPIRSVAVLPLADLSARSDESYFSSGMTDELIGALAKIRAWRVISRTSVMQYKDTSKALPVIARELGVDALVEGTVQRANDRVRITVRLVRAGREEENLWTQSYDRDVRDVLDVQADVARSIASQVKLTLTPVEQERLAARHPVDPNVFNLYLKGRASADQGTEDAIVKGIAYLEQALQTDRKYAPAHAAMALAYGSLTPSYRAPKDVMPKSREHAVRAIELDDTLSEAHTALARVMFFYDWDWAGAENEIRHAIELNTSSADAHDLYGNYLSSVEQPAKAIAELKLARELNPLALTTYSDLLATYVGARQYDSAIEESRRALAAYPNFAFAYAWLGMAYAMKGQFAEALPALTRARELDDNVTTTHFLAIAQAAAGNKAEATRLVKLLEIAAANRYTCAYEVATVHLHLGDRETAMQWLRRGMEEQCDCMVWLKSEPWMDPLRVDPRYADLVKRVGFPNP